MLYTTFRCPHVGTPLAAPRCSMLSPFTGEENMPCISLIVPVYNVKPHLSTCVESILAQTFTDFECILVDDGSRDGSAHLCDVYADRDARVRVIHQANAGVSSARNAGIQVAQGEWLAFVDADDCIHPAYLDLLLGAARTQKAQIACCSYAEIAENSALGDKGQRLGLDTVRTSGPHRTLSVFPISLHRVGQVVCPQSDGPCPVSGRPEP